MNKLDKMDTFILGAITGLLVTLVVCTFALYFEQSSGSEIDWVPDGHSVPGELANLMQKGDCYEINIPKPIEEVSFGEFMILFSGLMTTQSMYPIGFGEICDQFADVVVDGEKMTLQEFLKQINNKIDMTGLSVSAGAGTSTFSKVENDLMPETEQFLIDGNIVRGLPPIDLPDWFLEQISDKNGHLIISQPKP